MSWGKKKRLAPTASTAGTCLSVVNIGKTSNAKSSTASSPGRACWSLTVLLWGSVSAEFRPFHRVCVGGGGVGE